MEFTRRSMIGAAGASIVLPRIAASADAGDR